MGLDTVGFSQLRTALYFLIMFGIPIVPYLILYHTLPDEKSTWRSSPLPYKVSFSKMFGWMHLHHHPQWVHH
jgi:hypothetical protein